MRQDDKKQERIVGILAYWLYSEYINSLAEINQIGKIANE